MYGNDETSARRWRTIPIRRSSCALPRLAPNVASKRWAFEQYDSVVGSRTARRPEAADAAVLMLPESDRAIAVAIDGNGRRVACDPYAGTVEAVLECAQNLACVGAEPLGLTNCLNFGNPEKPNVAWQLDRAVLGLADACLGAAGPGGRRKRLPLQRDRAGTDLPDPGGRDGRRAARTRPRAPGLAPREGDRLVLVGPFAPSLAGSELAKQRGELDAGPAAAADHRRWRRGSAASSGTWCATALASAAHDVSDGGLACALAEMAIAGRLGIEVDLDPLVELRGGSGETCLFGEGPGGIVLAASRGSRAQSSARARRGRGRGRDRDRRGRRAIGSRSRPPSATSRSRSPTPSGPGALCRNASESERIRRQQRSRIEGVFGRRLSHAGHSHHAEHHHPLRRRVAAHDPRGRAARGARPC